MPGWSPAAVMGQDDARAAVSSAQAAGYLPGCHLWVDVEGVARLSSPMAVLQYIEAWAAVVLADGFRAGLYYGYDVPLSAAQLYGIRGIDQYWRAVPLDVATRGCSVVQFQPSTFICGVEVDVDLTVGDHEGDFPFEMSSWTA